MHAPRPNASEQGAALLLVLLLVTCVGVIAAAAISYASASMSAAAVYETRRAKSADAEGAIRTAMQYVKLTEAAGGSIGEDLGLACTTMNYPGSTGTVAVNVCPQADSLIPNGEYRASILTLGTDPSEGVKFTGNGQNDVGGIIFSNSIVAVSASQLNVKKGALYAWGACSTSLGGTITISNPTGSAQCGLSGSMGAKPKMALDPGDPSLAHQADWQPALSSPASMTQPAIPACFGWPVPSAVLSPGIYYDPAALSTVTTGCNVTLNPGVYFLDFPSTSSPWNITKTVTATCDGTGQGAQLVFANQSRLNLGSTGTLKITCGRKANASSTTPTISLYGLKSNAGTPGGPYTTVLRPAAATDTGATKYYSSSTIGKATPAGSAGYPKDSPASNATASVFSSGQTAELTLSSFASSSGPALTANANISSVVVKVAHDETTSTNFTTRIPKLVWGSCSVNLTPVKSGTSTLWTSGDLWSGGSGLSSCATFDPAAAMSIVWDVTTTSWTTQTIDLDGAEVQVAWADPGIPQLAGCPVTIGGCSLIDSTGGTLQIDDVVYLPTAKLAGAFGTSDSFPLASLVARAIDLTTNANASGGVQFGSVTATPMVGKVLFQASVGGTSWTDGYATIDPTTFAPTITAWVNRS